MTRLEELQAMNGAQLIAEADRIGVTVRCYRPAGKLTEAKAKVIDRIIAFEEANAVAAAEVVSEMNAEQNAQNNFTNISEEEVKEKAEKKAKAKAKAKEKAEPKRANQRIKEITYKGKTQSIRAWADELQIPWPTLYDRINRNGWSVEDAIEIPLGQRRPKN